MIADNLKKKFSKKNGIIQGVKFHILVLVIIVISGCALIEEVVRDLDLEESTPATTSTTATTIPSPRLPFWTKYSNNPVMVGRGEPTWYDLAVGDPVVIYDEGVYKMYYTASGVWFGSLDPTNIHTRVGYATSSDGINWDRSINRPVLDIGAKGQWDSYNIETVWVLKSGLGEYKMYYAGYTSPARSDCQIGLATSTDGINWNKYGRPILSKDFSIPWEAWGIWGPVVIKEDNIYKMWYLGISKIDGKGRLGFATSSDGINWIRYSPNPVLDLGSDNEWDSQMLSDFGIVKSDGIYYLFYSGSSDKGDVKRYEIGLATSPDGIYWTKSTNNPVFSVGESGRWDEFVVMAPSVLLEGDILRVWYHGVKKDYLTNPFSWGIGLATVNLNDIKSSKN